MGIVSPSYLPSTANYQYHENCRDCIASWNDVILPLSKSCPKLEQLSLFPWTLRRGPAISSDLILKLEKLVSVHFGMSGFTPDPVSVKWDWLESLAERGQLEYLYVMPRIPFELLCRVVAQCSVCHFCFDWCIHYEVSSEFTAHAPHH
jgi:hypothetical protein